MRHMRPWGHFGLIFTLGTALGTAGGRTSSDARNRRELSWSDIWSFRAVLTVLVGSWGLKQPGIWKKLALDTAVGRNGQPDLVGSFTRKTHPVARTGLSDA